MSRAVAVVVALALGLVAVGCAGEEPPRPPATTQPGTSTTVGTTAPPPPPGTSPPNASTGDGTGPRHIAVGGLALAPGEYLGFAFHPSTTPAKLAAPAGAALEVCPAETSGEIDETFGGWPEPGFTACKPFAADGTATLPAPTIPTFHLGFAVRATGASPVDLRDLTLDYEAVDGFFLVLSPGIPPGATGPTVTVTPEQFSSIRARAVDPKSEILLPDTVQVGLTQSGRPVPSNESTEGERRGRVYGLVNLGIPVTAQLTNTTDQPVPAQLLLDWT